ncbi:hypothetical protein KIN20_024826 [Parelaphostrongylus tenuis]|uniref:Uncharacterized protein n=1 Tax=Parelaphostrongylus tenuis TaxID=148309 RepID=A0AAD5N8L3_PARTN|nr:hypothetical protein KIN20_024826 [Parelaphostrongylus tenuis]
MIGFSIQSTYYKDVKETLSALIRTYMLFCSSSTCNDKFELQEELSKTRLALFASKARLDECEERVEHLLHVVRYITGSTRSMRFRTSENVVVRGKYVLLFGEFLSGIGSCTIF